MATSKKPSTRKTIGTHSPLTSLAQDAKEIDSFVSTLDLSGSLSLLLSKPKKKSGTKK